MTAASRNNALVVVSPGLMSTTSAEQLEALVGDEISHLANGDKIRFGLIQDVVDAFVIVAVTRRRPCG